MFGDIPMIGITEQACHLGIFYVWDHNFLTNKELSDLIACGDKADYNHYLTGYKECPNIIMASQKLLMANAVYPTIDRLVITSQSGVPVDTETSYTDTIYTTNVAEESLRSGSVNPYQVGWNIRSASANGAWGSFVLINSSGGMINRALAGVTKSANSAKLVIFTGRVVS
jgi:hypothetical protein